MKLKKIINVVCCVIIASIGITMTGCGNSSDKDAGNNTDTNIERSSDTTTFELFNQIQGLFENGQL